MKEALSVRFARMEENIRHICISTQRIEEGFTSHVEDDKANFKTIEGKIDKLIPYMIILSGLSIAIGWIAKGVIG